MEYGGESGGEMKLGSVYSLPACQLASVSTGLAFQLGERPADEFGDGMIF